MIGTKLILRVLARDTPAHVADQIHGWIEKELLSRDDEERDTQIIIVIGTDVS